MTTVIPSSLLRRALRAAVLVPALALVAACGDDDPVQPEPEPTFNRMVLTFSATGQAPAVVTITRANAAVSGPLNIAGNGTLTATFLNADGTPDAIVANNTADFQTRIELPAGFTAATFTRTGPHTFTVTRNATGTGQAQVQLFHLGENHDELEANVTVAAQ